MRNFKSELRKDLNQNFTAPWWKMQPAVLSFSYSYLPGTFAKPWTRVVCTVCSFSQQMRLGFSFAKPTTTSLSLFRVIQVTNLIFLTIQLVSQSYKRIDFLASRASKVRFSAYKPSL